MQLLFLASKSPRRAKLLTQLGIPFKVVAQKEVEAEIPRRIEFSGIDKAEAFVKSNAIKKAEAVLKSLQGGLVISGDTIIVTSNGEVLGKPQTPAEAFEMLQKLNNTWHHVFSAVAIIDVKTQVKKVRHSDTKVFFRKVPESALQNYICTGESFDKAGAYGIQGRGSFLLSKIEGSYSAVVGFPLELIVSLLIEFGVQVWDFWAA